MRRRAVLLVLPLTVFAACSSDGVTRPTLPNRTTVPTLEPSTTVAPEPTAAPPSDGAPPTEPPPTAAPDTVAPETVAPTPSPTQPPTTQPPVSEVATTVVDDGAVDEGAGTEDEERPWWPFVLLLVLVALGAAVVLSRGRQPRWRDRATALLDELDRVATQLAALPAENVRFVSPTEGAALATARATLTTLLAEAPDDTARSSMAMLAAPVTELHTALGAAALIPPPAPGVPPSPSAGPTVAQLAVALHTTSATVRAALAPPSPASAR